jgi:hypothetical protein
MKKQLFRALTLTTAILITSAIPINAQELTKDFNKTFTVSPSTVVSISNRYGDVKFETWNKNEVVIDVKVTVEMSSADRSEKLLSLIDVEFFESDTSVGAKTILDERFSSATRGMGKSRFSIDYTVKMPGNNTLHAANRYGNIGLGNHSGRVNIDLKYGNLAAMNLSRGNIKPLNTISIAYGKATIEEANWLSASIRYTNDLTITRVQAMTLDSRYSKIAVEDAGSLVIDSKYDNINVRNINNFVVNCAYTSTRLGTVSNTLDVEARYGSFDATTVPAGFESIAVDGAYCGIGIGIDPSSRYKLDARVSYGSLSYCEECVEIQRRIVESNTKEVSGIAGGDANPAATVDIKSSYGSVRLR